MWLFHTELYLVCSFKLLELSLNQVTRTLSLKLYHVLWQKCHKIKQTKICTSSIIAYWKAISKEVDSKFPQNCFTVQNAGAHYTRSENEMKNQESAMITNYVNAWWLIRVKLGQLNAIFSQATKLIIDFHKVSSVCKMLVCITLDLRLKWKNQDSASIKNFVVAWWLIRIKLGQLNVSSVFGNYVPKDRIIHQLKSSRGQD